MKNEQIVNMFTATEHAENTNPRKALRIQDGKLYSYNTVIAEYVDTRVEDQEGGFRGMRIYDHTAKGLGMISATTSQHVCLLKRATETPYHRHRVQIISE